MSIAIHNPSSLPVIGARIAIPDLNWSNIMIFNVSSGSFEAISSFYVISYNDSVSNGV